MLDSRRSFTLCFLAYSDSTYRDLVADFLEERLAAKVRVVIHPNTHNGTEALFDELGVDPADGPAQLAGLEYWPAGIDDLLTRLNYRRGALADRCPRPLLVWIPSLQLRRLATAAADLWAWRSGVFDFSLPPHDADQQVRVSPPIDRRSAAAPRRMERIAELERYLRDRTEWRSIDVALALELGDLRRSLGEVETAESAYRDATTALKGLDDRRQTAIAQGRIANMLEARGELDEALRIRTEEVLPVYERLGDVHSLAVTQGQIADILQARGELDEALRIRTEEVLPVYERLGDVRSQAVAKGGIADILQARGELDEALRIRTEEVLPVYERLGDVRSQAAAKGKIADILQARGELDEALRIRTEEESPVYKRLGDVHSLAVTQGQIADILQARGELDEALRIRTEEVLPVYERLGDVRSQAVAKGGIADILQARGELDEALRIRREEALPIFEQLGDMRACGITRATIAEILVALGRVDEAVEVYERDVLPSLQSTGLWADVESVVTRLETLRSSEGGSAKDLPSQP